MEIEAFTILKNIEDTWWHFGRTEVVRQALTVAHVQSGEYLDVGAGYGGMYPLLSQYGNVSGVEPNIEASSACRERGYCVFFNSVEEVIASGKSYDVVGVFDVIEHVEDDLTYMRHLFSITKQGGVLVATVPAFQWLWSSHDDKHHHFRRHTAKSMRTLLERSGYAVEYIRYWNVTLFPIACLFRLFGKGGESGLHPHLVITKMLKCLMWTEARIVHYLSIPFGLSIVIVGRKK